MNFVYQHEHVEVNFEVKYYIKNNSNRMECSLKNTLLSSVTRTVGLLRNYILSTLNTNLFQTLLTVRFAIPSYWCLKIDYRVEIGLKFDNYVYL